MLVKSVNFLPASIKSMNPVQKYPQIIEVFLQNLGLLQLICKASLIFKSNLEFRVEFKKENYATRSMLSWSVSY